MNPGNQLPDNTDLSGDKTDSSVEGGEAEVRYREGTESVNEMKDGSESPEAVEAGVEPASEAGSCDPVAGSSKKKTRFQRFYRNAIVEIVVLVVLAFTLAMTTKTYVVEAYEIKGRSMVPTFDDGQRVVVLKLFSDIQRGDIVIFASQDDPGKDLIKRVIALPGERIQISKGKVEIDGEPLAEEYVEDRNYGLYDAEIDELMGADQIYVLGDNRDDSHDSRRFGSVSFSNLKGKVVVRWWPFHAVKTF